MSVVGRPLWRVNAQPHAPTAGEWIWQLIRSTFNHNAQCWQISCSRTEPSRRMQSRIQVLHTAPTILLNFFLPTFAPAFNPINAFFYSYSCYSWADAGEAPAAAPTIILNFFFLPSCSLLSAPPLCKVISCLSYSAEYGISCLGSHHSLKTNNLVNSRHACACVPLLQVRTQRWKRVGWSGAIPFIHLFRAPYDEIQPNVLIIHLFLSFTKTEFLDGVE